MESIELQWDTVVSQAFAENAYLVHPSDSTECVIVDPGLDPQDILQTIDSANLVPVAILNTHGHSDHIAGNQAMKDAFDGIPLIIGEGDADKLLDPVLNLSAAFGMNLISPPADQLVNEGDVLSLAGMDWEVFDTPGHSRGHVVFVCKQASPWVVLGGDVLFRTGIGRTDFPDGSHQELLDSIRNKLFVLPDDTVVLPGHGPSTTIGFEKEFNPFLT